MRLVRPQAGRSPASATSDEPNPGRQAVCRGGRDSTPAPERTRPAREARAREGVRRPAARPHQARVARLPAHLRNCASTPAALQLTERAFPPLSMRAWRAPRLQHPPLRLIRVTAGGRTAKCRDRPQNAKESHLGPSRPFSRRMQIRMGHSGSRSPSSSSTGWSGGTPTGSSTLTAAPTTMAAGMVLEATPADLVVAAPPSRASASRPTSALDRVPGESATSRLALTHPPVPMRTTPATAKVTPTAWTGDKRSDRKATDRSATIAGYIPITGATNEALPRSSAT